MNDFGERFEIGDYCTPTHVLSFKREISKLRGHRQILLDLIKKLRIREERRPTVVLKNDIDQLWYLLTNGNTAFQAASKIASFGDPRLSTDFIRATHSLAAELEKYLTATKVAEEPAT